MLGTGKGYIVTLNSVFSVICSRKLIETFTYSLHIGTETEESDEFSVLRTPLRALSGHNGVVIAADWLPGGEQVRTQILRAIHK